MPLKQQLRFSHGGPEYDAKYPDGIPTAIDITLKSGKATLAMNGRAIQFHTMLLQSSWR